MTVLYRYENWQTAGAVDEWGYTVSPSTTYTGIREYEIVRTTPKGVWIQYGGTEKFVRLDARKRFACPTKEEALASFVARKEKQIRILKAQLRNAAEALRLVSTQSS